MKMIHRFISYVVWFLILAFILTTLSERKECSTECYVYSQLDCLDYREGGENRSGIYRILPTGMHYGYDVYCDMTTDGGGWMVFQRREDGSEHFQRGWYEYLAGFGNKSHEHWLGLTPLTRILRYGFYELRIDLVDWQNNTRYAQYKVFNVDPNDSYKLTVYDYSGTAGDSMVYHNEMKFSTLDKDNDMHNIENCSLYHRGAWWYNGCANANLNGVYGGNQPKKYGIFWRNWIDDGNYTYHFLKKTEMKLKRV